MALGQAQNLVAKIMKEKQVTRTELAARLGKGRSAITRLLSDGRNLTLKSSVLASVNGVPKTTV